MAGRGPVVICAFVLVASGWSSAVAVTRVGTTASLLSALERVKPGEVIRLEPGSYANVVIGNVKGPVTITSDDPTHPATLKDLMLFQSSKMTLSDLDLSAVDTPIGKFGAPNTVAFLIRQADGLVLRRLHVHGSPSGSLATDVTGMRVRDSSDVTLLNSDFEYLHYGFEHLNITGLVIRGSHFHHLRDDGIRGGGSSYVMIENNECDSNHPDADDIDHPDCIQLWTANTKQSAHDITIRNNYYHRGSGHPVQGVFVKDDYKKYPFLNLTITGNVIEGGLWNGISVDGAVGAVIENNRVCGYPDQLSWIMDRDDIGSVLRHNRAQKFVQMNSTGESSTDDQSVGACRPQAVAGR